MSQDLVELIEVEGMMEAEILQSKLQTFEIPSMLKYESMGRLCGITMDGLGKVKVMVPSAFIEQAREVLDSPSGEKP